MTTDHYRSPRLTTIGLGITLFVILLVLLCSLSQGVKWAGKVLSFLPERLGLIQAVHRAEVMPLDMRASPLKVTFPQAGAYHVYTSDYDLLVISDELARNDAPAWVTVTRAGDSSRLPVTFVERGLMPYDSPYASGRPVLVVHLPEPGTYVLDFPTRQANMTLVPDRTTGHEAVIFGAYAVQLLAIASPFALALYRREVRLRGFLRARRQSSQEKFDKIRELAHPPDSSHGEH